MNTTVENNTAIHEVYHGWKSPPNVRGTSDIIFVCVTTIFLCVYTAIHPNIPAPGEKQRYQILRKAKWVMVAVLAPEIVLNAAWTQFCEARALCQELRKVHQEALQADCETSAERNSVQDLPKAKTFDLTYGFHAVMGGCRIKVDNDLHPDFGTNNIDSLVVMPSALVKFARVGMWWNIDHATIIDKSKADHLAKSLVVLQLTWMCAQCIARAVAGLPMTLLEVHTFIHAICAATTFGIWFKKPLNIQEATTHSIDPCHKKVCREMITEFQSFQCGLEAWQDGQLQVPLTQRRTNFGFATRPRAFNVNNRDDIGMNNFVSMLTLTPVGDIVSNSTLLRGETFLLAFTLMQAAYGGVHLTAWHFAFPTLFELWAWRATSICIATTAPLVLLFVIPILTIKSTFVTDVWLVIWLGISLVLTVLGFASRIYIVVEAFISLRAVPAGVYEAIPWANYIPHL